MSSGDIEAHQGLSPVDGSSSGCEMNEALLLTDSKQVIPEPPPLALKPTRSFERNRKLKSSTTLNSRPSTPLPTLSALSPKPSVTMTGNRGAASRRLLQSISANSTTGMSNTSSPGPLKSGPPALLPEDSNSNMTDKHAMAGSRLLSSNSTRLEPDLLDGWELGHAERSSAPTPRTKGLQELDGPDDLEQAIFGVGGVASPSHTLKASGLRSSLSLKGCDTELEPTYDADRHSDPTSGHHALTQLLPPSRITAPMKPPPMGSEAERSSDPLPRCQRNHTALMPALSEPQPATKGHAVSSYSLSEDGSSPESVAKAKPLPALGMNATMRKPPLTLGPLPSTSPAANPAHLASPRVSLPEPLPSPGNKAALASNPLPSPGQIPALTSNHLPSPGPKLSGVGALRALRSTPDQERNDDSTPSPGKAKGGLEQLRAPPQWGAGPQAPPKSSQPAMPSPEPLNKQTLLPARLPSMAPLPKLLP